MRSKRAFLYADFTPFSRPSSTGKELDEETGFGYFGARYYDPTLLTSWTAVDPMSDKYPSLSPYNYCAWNPMKLVDPDGEAIYAYDEKTQLAIMGYMKKLFGETNIFKFKTNGNLEINHKEFRKYYKTATDDQKKLLDGFNEAIRSSKVATVKIQDNDNYFSFQASNDKYIQVSQVP